MKYILASCVALAACLAAGWLLVGHLAARAGRHLSRLARVACSLLCAVALACAAMLGYLGIYYHADGRALVAMEGSAQVAVTHERGAYLFDGPGEDGRALVFLPGAKVQAEAYAPLMLLLAEQGTDCYLVDPLANFSLLATGTVDRIIEQGPYERWTLAGHSLGGTVASMRAVAHADKVDTLVLLAAYPSERLPESMILMTIYGTDDTVLDAEAYEQARELWPTRTSEVVIEGGNHAGFGSYGAQRGDGTAELSPEAQQEHTAEMISMLYQAERSAEGSSEPGGEE